MKKDFDTIVVGGGFSGLSATLRSLMLGKRVLLLEKHRLLGGLNSYYQRGPFHFEVGLHALTNYCQSSDRKKTLNKILQQLRLPENFFHPEGICRSKIKFPHLELHFNQEWEYLFSQIETHFPSCRDGVKKLSDEVNHFPLDQMSKNFVSAREYLQKWVPDPLLQDMLLMPILFYGSSWEHDIDLSLFMILFKAIYLEGLFRPQLGIKGIIDILYQRVLEEGGIVCLGEGVLKIKKENLNRWEVTSTSGRYFSVDQVISSIGYPETLSLLMENKGGGTSLSTQTPLSFVESQMIFQQDFKEKFDQHTLTFFNQSHQLNYQVPDQLWDSKSTLFCSNGSTLRLTFLANGKLWSVLDRAEYLTKKKEVYQESLQMAEMLYGPLQSEIVKHDTFTPLTIERFTGHRGGGVYGGFDKLKEGVLDSNLFLCGTDQGLLGVVGAMMSGILMANKAYQIGG